MSEMQNLNKISYTWKFLWDMCFVTYIECVLCNKIVKQKYNLR